MNALRGVLGAVMFIVIVLGLAFLIGVTIGVGHNAYDMIREAGLGR